MAMRERPVIDTGLIIAGDVAAYVSHKADMKTSSVPKEIMTAIGNGKTMRELLENPNSHRLLDSYGYFDPDITYQDLTALGIKAIYCNMFTGEIKTLFPDTPNGYTQTCTDNAIVYIPTARRPMTTDDDPNAIVEKFKKNLTDILPDDFDYLAHIVAITGTNFS